MTKSPLPPHVTIKPPPNEHETPFAKRDVSQNYHYGHKSNPVQQIESIDVEHEPRNVRVPDHVFSVCVWGSKVKKRTNHTELTEGSGRHEDRRELGLGR